MPTIWKQELNIRNVMEISLPAGSEILCVQTQHNIPCIWFRCEPDDAAEDDKKVLSVCGTGDACPDASEGKYIGTFQINGGDLIFHLFDIIR